MFLLVSSVGWSYPIADSLRFPLDVYHVSCNYFGAKDICVKNGKWHLGEDSIAKAGTSVYAPGNGSTREAQTHGGYGGMYIIESTLPNGEKVCFIIPHLDYSSFTKKVGEEVKKGDYLGKIGTSEENGGWSEHFHFGVYKGAYRTTDNLVCGDWIYSGYTNCEEVLKDWYNPTIFINGIGRYADGFHTDGTSQAFVNCFTEFSAFIGNSYDNGGGIYVHRVGIVLAQDVRQDMCKPHYGDDGKCCLILSNSPRSKKLKK